MSPRDEASAVDFDPDCVLNYRPLPKGWTNTRAKKLEMMYHEGQTISWMADVFGADEAEIRRVLVKIGLNPDFRLTEMDYCHPVPALKKDKTDMTVKLTHLITLMQKGYTTCQVKFRSSETMYTYKVSDELAKKLRDEAVVDPAPQVIVPTKDHFSIGTVVDVHDEPDIDVNAPYSLGWVVQLVDRTHYDEQVKKEAEAVKMLKKAERKRAQEKALADLLGDVDREQLQALLNVK